MLSYTRVLQGWWYIVYVALVSAVSRGDTYPSETHSKLRRSAAVGYRPLTLSWFRKAGPTTILNIIGDASVPLRGTIWGGSIASTHSCAASQLAVGFII